jgi:FkbM family methyltransferase
MNEKLVKYIKTFARPYVDKHFGQIRNRRFSYAQEGEDLVVDRLLEGKKNGFYVEVGCHHPFRFSNTYMFYKKGWRGICIDPLPGTKELFYATRPRDFVIEVGVGEQGGTLIYYMFNEPALNTFDSVVANSRDGIKGFKIIKQQLIEVRRLDEILTSIPNIPAIDIMSVDVEGFDLQTLKSNDWKKFRPKIVIAECLASDLLSVQSDPINSLLTTLGYVAYAKTGHSIIFKLNENV